MTHQDKMKNLADLTDLVFDGGNDENRLFDDNGREYVNLVEMGEEKYNEWEDNLNKTTVHGKGFDISAWCDMSGYDYWLNDEGYNYQMVTVSVYDIDLTLKHHETIIDKLDEFYDKISNYSEYYCYNCGYPSNEDIEWERKRRVFFDNPLGQALMGS